MKPIITIYCFLHLFLVNAQNYETENFANRVSEVFTFDGVVSDVEWSHLKALPFVSHAPDYSEIPMGKTMYYIAYDDLNLYVAAKCFDDTENIQKPSFERDEWNMSMDCIALFIDTYNDNENAVLFSVSATGSRIDGTVTNDAQTGGVDLSWNSFWEAKVSQNPKGWEIEAKIPFSSLRYQVVDGKVTMGIIANRYMPKKRQMDIFPKVKPNWGFWSFAKPSQAHDVDFYINKSKRPWFTSPYVLGTLGHFLEQEEKNQTPIKKTDNQLNFGIDVQHAITNNLNMDLSVNTDFSQVEADDQIVNLNRFSLFFPEKRRFFLERSGVMDFSFDDSNRLFYSRQIGIQNGDIVPLWGGVRIVGRMSDFDIGVLNMQSQGTSQYDSENFGVYRIRKKIGKTNSYIGGMLTSRMDFKGETSLSYGIDGNINVFKDDYLKVNLAATSNSNNPGQSLKNNKRIYVLWEDRNVVGFNYAFAYSQVDPEYKPSLGFEARTDYRSGNSRLSYGWLTDSHPKIRQIKADLKSQIFHSISHHELESFSVSPSASIETKTNASLTLAYNYLFDKVRTPFLLSPEIEIQPNEYFNNELKLSISSPTIRLFNVSSTAVFGSYYGGNRVSLDLSPVFVLSKYLTLEGFYQFNQIDFENNLYTSHLARLKIATALNVKWSLNAFVQHNSLAKSTNINARIRFNNKDGNDLYLVYNELLNNQFRSNFGKNYFSEYRYFTVKYVHTFKL